MRGRLLSLGSVILAGGLVGCGSKPTSTSPSDSKPSPTLSVSNSVAPNTVVATTPAAVTTPSIEPKLDQPFSEAVFEDSPGNQQAPPDRTLAGKSTGQLRLEVQTLWETVRFVSPSGKPISYRAVLTTDHGPIMIELQPRVAPNHVRNFICLARAGYYDGLLFEHVIRQPVEDAPGSMLELVEGGCPVGTGEPGVGHLGYWLRPEFSESITHAPGTVGAYHDDSPESAACRFYIALSPAPAMDGSFTAFGRVVAGLDVVRTISKQPNVEGTIQPVNPVVIRSVKIESEEGR